MTLNQSKHFSDSDEHKASFSFTLMTMELTAEQLMSRYERLRNEDVYKDVTLTSHECVVSAHKCILSVGSEFFNLLFRQAERKRDMLHRFVDFLRLIS